MPRKSMEILTESMFYVLMALRKETMYGIEIANLIEKRTTGRTRVGPATLYTVLGKFQKEEYIRETEVEGRKRSYAITAQGIQAYREECQRLLCCLRDAEEDMETGN